MGNTTSSQPKNKTGKNVVHQKLENAKKTGVLSLREHKLEEIPKVVFQITTLRTLDVSRNNLKSMGENLAILSNLKSLQCDENKLPAGSLAKLSSLSKLQSLSAGGNKLGLPVVEKGAVLRNQPEALPALPVSLRQLKLDNNSFSSIPMQICNSSLVKLEKLDVSMNNLASIPPEISNLVSLIELNLDQNSIVSLPEELGELHKLKVLSLKNNQFVGGSSFSAQNPQPLPAVLFSKTPLIDLNLHGNKMTYKQLTEFDGFDDFLDRRKKVKSKDLYGGALTDFDVCGLD